jgi:hypothetical protein
MTKKNRNIIIIVLVILLAVLTTVLITYREKTFNLVELGKENAVLNRTDKLYLDTIVSVGLSELGIAGITVLIDPLEKELTTEEFEILAHIIGTQNQFIIFTNEFSREKALEVMSHELIHLQQYNTGRLVKTDGGVIWEGYYIESIEEIPYMARPWELEAFVLGENLKRTLRVILIKK